MCVGVVMCGGKEIVMSLERHNSLRLTVKGGKRGCKKRHGRGRKHEDRSEQGRCTSSMKKKKRHFLSAIPQKSS